MWQATPGSTHRFRRGIMLSTEPNRMRSSLEKLRSSGWRQFSTIFVRQYADATARPVVNPQASVYEARE